MRKQTAWNISDQVKNAWLFSPSRQDLSIVGVLLFARKIMLCVWVSWFVCMFWTVNEEQDVHDSKMHFDMCVIVQCVAMDKLNLDRALYSNWNMLSCQHLCPRGVVSYCDYSKWWIASQIVLHGSPVHLSGTIKNWTLHQVNGGMHELLQSDSLHTWSPRADKASYGTTSGHWSYWVGPTIVMKMGKKWFLFEPHWHGQRM